MRLLWKVWKGCDSYTSQTLSGDSMINPNVKSPVKPAYSTLYTHDEDPIIGYIDETGKHWYRVTADGPIPNGCLRHQYRAQPALYGPEDYIFTTKTGKVHRNQVLSAKGVLSLCNSYIHRKFDPTLLAYFELEAVTQAEIDDQRTEIERKNMSSEEIIDMINDAKVERIEAGVSYTGSTEGLEVFGVYDTCQIWGVREGDVEWYWEGSISDVLELDQKEINTLYVQNDEDFNSATSKNIVLESGCTQTLYTDRAVLNLCDKVTPSYMLHGFENWIYERAHRQEVVKDLTKEAYGDMSDKIIELEGQVERLKAQLGGLSTPGYSLRDAAVQLGWVKSNMETPDTDAVEDAIDHHWLISHGLALEIDDELSLTPDGLKYLVDMYGYVQSGDHFTVVKDKVWRV